jgi:YHS domain-containing protein
MSTRLLAGMFTLAMSSLLVAVNIDKSAEKEECPKPKLGKQTTCPVSGKPVDPNVSLDQDGLKVLFCCKECVGKFKSAPSKYLPAVYKQVYPQRIQTKCPVMDEEIDPEVFTDYNGERIYLCCKGCDKKISAEPAKYLPKLADDSIAQVHCPVMGEPIDPAVFVEKDGKKVYFCCKGCVPKYSADPARYAGALRPTAGLLAFGELAKDDLVLCPVCTAKGEVHKRGDAKIVEHEKVNYALCNDGCVAAFKAEPGRYAKALRDEMIKRAGGPGKAYTCSMDPQIVSALPAKCPSCGMRLAK